jgi:hypothetical protein
MNLKLKSSAAAAVLAFAIPIALRPATDAEQRETAAPDLRAIAERFHDAGDAVAAGYVQRPLGCSREVTFVRADLLGIDRPATAAGAPGPSLIIYDRQADGRLALAAVENVTVRWAWRDSAKPQPAAYATLHHDLLKDDPQTKADEAHMFVPQYDVQTWAIRGRSPARSCVTPSA